RREPALYCSPPRGPGRPREPVMPKVTFTKQKKEIEVPKGANLRQVMLDNGIEVYTPFHKKKGMNCGVHGSCGTCRVYLKEGEDNASARGLKEKLRTAFAFFAIGHEGEVRLSCQTKV